MSGAAGLARFLEAQDRHWAAIREELAAGRKTTHWMWYVFPQMAALGRSATAKFYGIEDQKAAAAYLAHPVLGPRLLEVTELVLAAPARMPEEIFGPVDAIKLRSSMTLFDHVAPGGPFAAVLAKYWDGAPDPATLALLSKGR